MNAERLLVHYERIVDAPDAVSRLRRFVLDLAVRGKLVPQDPNDEPASELLKRIATKKTKLVKAGEIKAGKPLSPVGGSAVFEVPAGWQWTRLGNVTSYLQRGKSPKYAVSDGALVVSQKCVQWSGLDLTVAKQVTLKSLADYEPVRFLRDGDLLWNSTGTGTIGRVIRLRQPPEKLICDGHVTVVRCAEVDPEYIRTWLRSDHVFLHIEDRAAGSTNQVELTAQIAISQVVPLPPLAEQHRIVAKFDELMALCDRLEAARQTREAARDKLAAASLARVNAPDPETFRADARFAVDALPALTARADQIKQIRQSILNLAVRGNLAPQDASAEVVVERYQREPGRPDLPSTWRSLNFGKFCDIEGGNQPPKSQFIDEPRQGYVQLFQIRDLGDRPVPTFIPIASARSLCEEGEILIGRYGASVGKVFWAKNGAYNVAMVKFIWPKDALIPEFAFLLLKSEYLQGPLSKATRSAQAGFNKGDLSVIDFPLPPLAEQSRIIAKVDELMALCDQLETSLASTDDTRRSLLEALLAEALAPVGRELAAAE